jgi:putative flippase GtrA
MRRAAHRPFAKFAGIGALGTGVHYSILVALVTLGGAAPAVDIRNVRN